MKKLRSFFRSPMATTLLFLLAVVFLVTGTIGGVRAAPTIFNATDFDREFELDQIGTSLVETNAGGTNTYTGQSNTILAGLVPTGEKFAVGKAYDEELSVLNSGSIPTYVRVTIYKYWVDENGNKMSDLKPEDIELTLLTGSDWMEDTSARTDERTVLYYTNLLDCGDTTSPFADGIKINGDVLNIVKQTNNNGVITNLRLVDGKTFTVEVEVNAVQDHSARSAIWSVWGLSNPGSVGLSVSDN